jgi:hypothetical protein
MSIIVSVLHFEQHIGVLLIGSANDGTLPHLHLLQVILIIPSFLHFLQHDALESDGNP